MAGMAMGSGNRSPVEHAQTMLGKGEVPDRAALQDYLKTGGVNLDPKTTAWCAAFVNASLNQGGYKNTGSPSALSFENYGERVEPGGERPGDIAVYRRGPGQGHVGFYQGRDQFGNVQLLGGNQGQEGRVTNTTVPPPGFGPELVGFRRPVPWDPTPQAPPQEAYRSEPVQTPMPLQAPPQEAYRSEPPVQATPAMADWLTKPGGSSRGWFS